ncbi:MAG: hypothetical protein JWP01_922 [Myxococcales bacterium]|nr:hypothetical protein [Myxococcales bacterium]
MLRPWSCLVLAVVVAASLHAGGLRRAHAQQAPDAVALLPLDADHRLEIYGQPVASEIARVLVAGDIDVVVVGPKMAVPERAKLIVDGRIASAKGDAVVLTLRVRSRVDGTVLSTMQATATSLATIDKAAADLSARVLPEIRGRLAAMRTTAEPPRRPTEAPPPVATTPKQRPMLVSVRATNRAGEPLQAPLVAAVATWAGAHRREPVATDPELLGRKRITDTVKASGNDLAIAFEIVGFTFEPGPIPFGRARVRVRISDAVGIVFDRVIVTDSVVGDKAMTLDGLAVRTAREVVDIMRPHVQRTVAGWR